MSPLNQSLIRAIVRRAPQTIRTPLRRTYATNSSNERIQQTLKTSSRLTWLITSAAALAGVAYVYANPTTPTPLKIDRTTYPNAEPPKPVEDRHGDSVAKHSIAADKNQNKVRTGVFKEGQFDNHLQKHTRDPSKDFEEVERK